MFENPTVHLSALHKSSAKIAFCSSELIFPFLYADSSTQIASEQFVSFVHLACSKFVVHPTPQTQLKTKLQARFKGL
jgi:hypothetical protein